MSYELITKRHSPLENIFAVWPRVRTTEALVLQAHNALGLALFFQGDFAAAREHLEQSFALYDLEQHRLLAFSYAGMLREALARSESSMGCRNDVLS
jgi:hypothetical protein